MSLCVCGFGICLCSVSDCWFNFSQSNRLPIGLCMSVCGYTCVCVCDSLSLCLTLCVCAVVIRIQIDIITGAHMFCLIKRYSIVVFVFNM